MARNQLFESATAHGLALLGDINEASKWLNFARAQLGGLIARQAGATSLFLNPVPNIQIQIYTRPNKIIISAGAGGNIVGWFNNGDVTAYYMRTTIYSGKPSFATTPEVALGALKNAPADPLIAQNTFGYKRIRTDAGATILFNGPVSISDLFRNYGGTNTNLRRLFTPSLGQKQVAGISGVTDVFGGAGYVFATSITHSGNICRVYLEKMTASSSTTALFIETTYTYCKITTYHSVLGTIVNDITASIPSLGSYENPRCLSALISPDGKFLSIAIITSDADLSRGYTGTNATSPVYSGNNTILDFVVRLDADGVEAISDSIAIGITNGAAPAAGVANKSSYLDAIAAGSSIHVSTFKFFCGFERVDTITAPVVNYPGNYYYGIDALCNGALYVREFHPDLTVVNAGVLHKGSYEADFLALCVFPVLSSSFTYPSTAGVTYDGVCFSSADVTLRVTLPESGTVVDLAFTVLTTPGHLKLSDISGTYQEEYKAYSLGSPIVGIVYSQSKNIDGIYERYWLDVTPKFLDRAGIAKTTNPKVDESYRYMIAAPDAHLYSVGDIAARASFNPGKKRERTVTEANSGRAIYEISVNGEVASQFFTNIVVDSKEHTVYEFRSVYEYVNTDANLVVNTKETYPTCERTFKTTSQKKTDLLNNSSNGVLIGFSDKTFNVTTARWVDNSWDQSVKAILAAGSDATLVPNGIQVSHAGKDRYLHVEAVRTKIPSGIAEAVYVSAEQHITNTSTPTVDASSISSINSALFNIGTYLYRPQSMSLLDNTGDTTFIPERKTEISNMIFDLVYAGYSGGGGIFEVGKTHTVFYCYNPLTINSNFYEVAVDGVKVTSLQGMPSNVFTNGSNFGLGYGM